MTLIATGTRLVVKKIQDAMTTTGGILLHNTTDYPKVIAISLGSKVTADIKPNDELIIDWGRCGRIEYDDQTYFVVDQSNVLAVVDPL